MEFEQLMRQAAEYLVFDPSFISPKEPQGLWIFDNAADVSAVQINAVCLHGGASYEDIAKCRPFFAAFPYLVIAAPNAIAREKLVRELRPRLPACCVYVIQDAGFRGCASMRAYIDAYGYSEVLNILSGAVELPAYGILDLSAVEDRDMTKIPRTLSGFDRLDKSIGGFFAGELSVWTGKRGVGKSTLLSQLLLESVNQGHAVCAYSGELDSAQFREWAYLQAAGPEHIGYRDDPLTGKQLPTVSPQAKALITEWIADRFWLFDLEKNTRHNPESILSQFAYAKMRYGADVFLVDNLMAVELEAQRGFDLNLVQARFTQALSSFAKRQHVHVHLVVHPRKAYGAAPQRKTEDLRNIDADEVSGSGDITNRADNVFYLTTHLVGDGKEAVKKPILVTLKNRDFGSHIHQWLDFDKKSRRFYADGAGDPKRPYGWDMAAQQMELRELAGEERTPFDEKEE